MVLLDDNFATIVRAVREGRKIYDNIRRFVKYALTTNSAEVWTIFLAPFLGLPIPLLPIHILWINLVTDGLPGLALAAEPEERDVMRRPPRPPQESVFAHGLGVHVIWVGILMARLPSARRRGSSSRARRTGRRWCSRCSASPSSRTSRHPFGARVAPSRRVLSNAPLAAAVALTVALQLAVLTCLT